MNRRIVLIGCSKTKLPYKPERRRGGRLYPTELYGGDLFPKRVAYAESRNLPWMVLSAEYGVWNPNQERKPYDTAFSDLSPADRADWHARVAYHVIQELFEPFEVGEANRPLTPSELTVEIHAGRDYAEPLATILTALGINVELPCKGLAIGQQKKLYASGSLSPAAA
ncbi:hypothetical protein LOC67_23590 [Stieleria sp. JC731]|uniref:DUF6884 domain-containing protein n=1 Tax=Pirellulaceae TaxID=2691357 RepID=UPI001E2B098F|nr:DUF6884 domain-containing protein [Stieleria sp. JC731]MCC9603544.1 hypothetical protein [Stieleria sp. JC731]